MFLPSVGDGIPDVMMPGGGANVLVLQLLSSEIKFNSPSASSPDGDRILAPSVIVFSDDAWRKKSVNHLRRAGAPSTRKPTRLRVGPSFSCF